MSDKPKQRDDGNESDLEFELEVHPVEDGVEHSKDGKKAVDPREALGNKTKQRVSVAGEDVKRRFKARLFSLKNNRMKKSAINLAAPANRSFDYEEMYEEDEYGKEAFPEARVWKVHNDETQLFDQERVDAWRDALDVLLVFIGLFSAIVTTFVVQTSQSLQPDYAQMTVIVALEILRTMTNSSIPTTALPSTILDRNFGQAAPSNSDKVVNGLWFTSLAVSLSTALLTVLTKQWLYHYTTSTSGNSRERARIRQFRYGGLEAYRVPLIIDLLPILLHLALALFLIGLTIFLTTRHKAIAGIVGSIMALSYILYVISVYLPIRDPRCPYKSPLSFYTYWLYHGATRRVKRIIARPSSIFAITPANIIHAIGLLPSKIPRPTLTSVTRRASSTFHSVRTWASDEQKDTPATLSIAETVGVRHGGSQLDVDAIVYLYNTSSNSTVRTIALEGFCGLVPSDADARSVYKILDTDLSAMVSQYAEIKGFVPNATIPANMFRKIDRLLRSLCIVDRVRLSNSLKDHHLFDGFITGAGQDWDSFRSSLFPTLFPSAIVPRSPFPFPRPTDCNILSTPFAGCLQYELSLPIWAQIIRTAIRSQPTDHVIRSTLLGFLHDPSVKDTEMGAVTLKTAMQHPFVRHLALEYLRISDAEEQDLPMQFLSSFHNLLCEEDVAPDLPPSKRFWRISQATDILSSLFVSLADHTRPKWEGPTAPKPVSEKKEQLIRSIFQHSFEPSDDYEIPWKALLAALNAVGDADITALVTTPSWIHSLLHRFRPRPPCHDFFDVNLLETHEVNESSAVICKIVKKLESLLLFCEDAELAQAILHSIHKLDMLPSGIPTPGKLLIVDLFWSPRMVRMFVWKALYVKCAQDSGPEWFNEVLLLIHAPERLIFLCKQLLLCSGDRLGNPLYPLFRIEPHHTIWPATFKSLLHLLDDGAHFDEMVDTFGDAVRNPCQIASKTLRHAKRLLETRHPILHDSRFDIPQFDDNGNLITAEQLRQESDLLLNDTALLRSGNCVDSEPAPSTPAAIHPTHDHRSHDLPSLNPSPHPNPTTEVDPLDLGGSATGPVHDEHLPPASNKIAHEPSGVVDGASPHVIVEIDHPSTNHAHLHLEDLAADSANERQSQSRSGESKAERGEGGGSC